ncbi:major facilitator superfamily domain-containing protein [Mycena galopus ATCC 62051]|nr:major facilitator superfamily domain-containing protein [Mycena galopus ATCC 62051]
MPLDGETSPLLSGTPSPSRTPTLYSNDSDLAYDSQDPRASFTWLIPVAVMASLSDALTTFARQAFFRQFVCEEIGGLPATPDPSLLGFNSTAFSRLDCSGPPLFPGMLSINIASMIVACLLSACSTGWWSRLGDMHGRRYPLMVSILGSIILNLIFALIASNPALDSLAQPCIFIGLLFEGLLGGSATIQGAVHAYAADVSPAGSWSGMFSVLQGLLILCSVLGSGIALGANFISSFLPFSISAGLGGINLVFIFFFLPESLPEEFQVDRPAKPTLKDVRASIYSTVTTFASDHRLVFYGLALFIYSLTLKVESLELLIILRKDLPSPTLFSAAFFVTLSLLARMATCFFLFPALLYILKRRTPLSLATSTKQYFASVLSIDGSASRFSVLVDFLSQLIIIVLPTSPTAIFFLLALVTPLSFGIKPALYAVIAVSSEVRGDAAKRGALFGAISVVGMIGETLSPIMYVTAYTSFWQQSIKAGFILTAALLALVGLFLWSGRVGSRGGSAEQRTIPRENTPERIRIVVSDETVRHGHGPDLLDPGTFSPVYRRHREGGGAGTFETGSYARYTA